MAFVWRHPLTKNWQIGYYNEVGERLNKTSGTPDKRKAQSLATGLEKALAAKKAGALFECRARELLNGVLTDAGYGSIRQPTSRAFIQGWLEAKLAGLGQGSKWSYQRAVATFLDGIGIKADAPLEAIQPADARAYLAHLQAAGYAPKSVSLWSKVIRASLREAVNDGLIPSNPFGGTKVKLKEGHKRGLFTDTEVALLIKAADEVSPDWKTAVLVGAYTGARLRDCCRLQWGSVDLTSGKIQITQLKTGARITLPSHRDVKANLEERASEAGDSPVKFVTPTLSEAETGGAKGLSLQFAAIMRRAGVSAGRVSEGKRRKQNERGFHSLRHTFVSALANAGIAPEIRMKLSGHADEKSHEIYSKLEFETLADAVAKLPSYQ